MAVYEFLLEGAVSGTVIDQYPFQGVAWSRELNGAGGFTGTLPLHRYELGVADTITRGNINSRWSTILWVLRDGRVVWGGFVTGLQPNLADNTLQVAGQGFWAYYQRRHLAETFGGTAIEQFDFVENLVDYAHGFTGGDLDVTVSRTPTDSGQTREDEFLLGEFPKIAEIIESFAERQNGFDFELVASGTRTTRTKTLHLAYPRRGKRTPWVWATAKNIVNVSYTEDGLSAANIIVATGAGEPPFMLFRGATDNAALSESMLTQDSVSHPQVSVGPTLRDHAFSTLRTRSKGARTLTVTLEPDADAEVESFIPGDEVRIMITQPGWLELDEIWRIVRYTVHPDDSGSELIDVELAPLDAFILT